MSEGKYVAKLSKDECSHLKILIGQKGIQVFAPNLFVQGTEYESCAYCISLFEKERRWINLTNSWVETTNEVSYYKIGVELSEKPYGIELTKEGHLLNASGISIGGNIVKIELYTQELVFNYTVVFDKALIFYTDKGKKFCISAIESVRDQLNFTFDEERIEYEIYGCILRETIL